MAPDFHFVNIGMGSQVRGSFLGHSCGWLGVQDRVGHLDESAPTADLGLAVLNSDD